MTIGKDAPGKGEMLLQRSDEPSVQGGQQPPGTRLPELPGGAAAGANRGASEPTDAREVVNPPAWFSEPNRMLDNPAAASDWDEFAKNGAFIDWGYWARRSSLTPMQAAQFAHLLDAGKWRHDPKRCAQGPLPEHLLTDIENMREVLEEKAARWTLTSLVEFLGENAPPGMRRAVEAAHQLMGPSHEPAAQTVAVTHRQSGEGAPDGIAGPAPLTTREMAEALDGIKSRDADRWTALLGDATRKAKWATTARVAVSTRPGHPALWNPVDMAKVLIGRGVKRESIARAFRDREVLAPWLPDWRREQSAFRELERYY